MSKRQSKSSDESETEGTYGLGGDDFDVEDDESDDAARAHDSADDDAEAVDDDEEAHDGDAGDDEEDAGEADNDEPEEDEPEEDEPPVTSKKAKSRATASSSARVGTASEFAKSVSVARTNAERRAMMIRLDEREGKYVTGGAILAAALTLGFTLPYMLAKIRVESNPPVKPLHKTCPAHFTYAKSTATCNTIYPPSHYLEGLILGLVCAVALYVARRYGRRVPAAFIALITGLALSNLIAIVAFFWLAIWLLLRAYRVQKWGDPTAKGPVTDDRGRELVGAAALRTTPDRTAKGRAAPAPARNTKAGTRSASSTSAKAKRSAPPPAGPTASKRYTPKKPPRRPPPKPAKDD